MKNHDEIPKSSGGCSDLPALQVPISVTLFPMAQPIPAKANENATILNGC